MVREAFETFPHLGFRPGENCAAFLHERATVSISSSLGRRVGALSPEGVIALQQRIVHEMYRVVVSLPLLHQATIPLCVELELLEDWNERHIDSRLLDGEPDDVTLLGALEVESKAFYEILCTKLAARIDTSNYSRKWSLLSELQDFTRYDAVRNAVQNAARKRKLDSDKTQKGRTS